MTISIKDAFRNAEVDLAIRVTEAEVKGLTVNEREVLQKDLHNEVTGLRADLTEVCVRAKGVPLRKDGGPMPGYEVVHANLMCEWEAKLALYQQAM